MRYLLVGLMVAPAFAQDTLRFHANREPKQHRRYLEAQVNASDFTLEAWGGECTFAIDLKRPGFNVRGQDRRRSGDTIRWDAPWGGFEIYPLPWAEGGGMEWAVHLNAEPPVNSVTFSFTSSGLRFVYQPPLSDSFWMPAFGWRQQRPDSVDGSWAVERISGRGAFYHPGDSVEDYGTGKMFHVYRPKAWDQAGDTQWGEIVIDTAQGAITVTIDAAWLASASYPVTIDPTFGYNTAGASLADISTECIGLTGETDASLVYTASSGDELDSLRASLITGDDCDNDSIGLCLYDLTANTRPNNFIVGDTIAGISCSQAWYGAAVSQSLSDGVSYGPGAGMINTEYVAVYYDTGGTEDAERKAISFGADWGGPGGADESRKYSLVAVYNIGGGGTKAQIMRVTITE